MPAKTSYIKVGGSSRFAQNTLWAHPHGKHGQHSDEWVRHKINITDQLSSSALIFIIDLSIAIVFISHCKLLTCSSSNNSFRMQLNYLS